ncbi:hypothetical protein HY251_15425 [bacterium]|nr:hypothetical protein [bacterium]
MRAAAGVPAADRLDVALARWGIASIWLLTGALVVHPFYRRVGLEFLGRLGLPGWLMLVACAGEIVLGLRVGLGKASTVLCALQVAGIAFFTAVLACEQPALLVHRFGVLTKNVPIVALVLVSWLIEREGWSARARWILRSGMAAIWITEGLFPKILFQGQDELATVVASGLVPGDPSRFLVFMGACQVASGIAALVLDGRALRMLLLCQAAALVFLPLLVSWQDPLLWVHPFGPMTKNLPILAGTILAARRGPSARFDAPGQATA